MVIVAATVPPWEFLAVPVVLGVPVALCAGAIAFLRGRRRSQHSMAILSSLRDDEGSKTGSASVPATPPNPPQVSQPLPPEDPPFRREA